MGRNSSLYLFFLTSFFHSSVLIEISSVCSTFQRKFLSKMDLSNDSQNSKSHLQFLKSRSRSISPNPLSTSYQYDHETIDVSQIIFEDDESWLTSSIGIPDQQMVEDLNHKKDSEEQKYFDSRTFTRPKKKFTRPSIERYNEEIYGSASELIKSSDRSFSRSFVAPENEELNIPVNFDLSQPSSIYYFERILAETGEAESFTNMSPPSLVNSMCSSTFANLMDSSFIVNDPVLREIRDADVAESVLLQDCEPPMFHSITESCSSLNSDSPESFLRKMSFNGTFKKNSSKDSDTTITDEKIEGASEIEQTTGSEGKETNDIVQNESVVHNNQTFAKMNGTYRRSPKPNRSSTFRKSDRFNTITLSSPFEFQEDPGHPETDMNSTQTLIKNSSIKSLDSRKSSSVEDMLKQAPREIHTDSNRLSYHLDDEHLTFNNDINRLANSPLGCSMGSADSSDRMSSSVSSSSRGSNKMLNMADVDAIVEMQERSLHQVMSTPKPSGGTKKLWENNFISPIILTAPNSDSDVSSTDEYKSVRSTVSKTSLDSHVSKPVVKALGHISRPIDTKIRINQKSAYTMSGQKPLQVISSNNGSSNPNLKMSKTNTNLPGSQSNMYRPSNIRVPSAPSNLKTMQPKLKGSYTSLRPISANLPVAPPLGHPSLNVTATLPRATNPNVTQNVERRSDRLERVPKQKETVSGDSTFMVPQPPRVSGLPRPMGIPRPVSRIPAPRGRNLR